MVSAYLMFLDAFVKLRLLTSPRLSVRPYGTTQLPLDGFSWNFIFGHFSKLWRKIKVSLKSDMKTNTQFWSYLTQLLLQWEMFQTKFVEKIKTRILCSVTFVSEIVPPYEII